MSIQVVRKLHPSVDLKHLRYAVAAADYGSFRRAAEALNIQQSTLSRSISMIENATSTALFHRSPNGVALSAFGKRFIRMAKLVLDQLDEFASGQECSGAGILRLGFCTSLSAGGLRSNVLDFSRRFSEYQLSMLERPRSRLCTKLQNGSLDIVIVTGKLPINRFLAQVLWSERVLIALPETHVLAERDVVYWTDLRGETMLMSRYDPYWEFENLIAAKLTAQDDRPKIERHDVSRSILKSLVSLKLGLGLVLESDIGVRVPSIVFKELRDGSGASRVDFSAFWCKANGNPALVEFLKILKEHYPVLF